MLERFTGDDIQTRKGGVFQTAIVAGIMAAKRTSELITLCHTLGLEHCDAKIALHAARELEGDCVAVATSKTGVEMEALVLAGGRSSRMGVDKAFMHINRRPQWENMRALFHALGFECWVSCRADQLASHRAETKLIQSGAATAENVVYESHE